MTMPPSLTGISMISPATSGEIFTSVSGCTLPVAVTSWVMVFTTAFSVVTGMLASFFREAAAKTTPISATPTIPSTMMSLRLDFFLAGTGAVRVTGAVGFVGADIWESVGVAD